MRLRVSACISATASILTQPPSFFQAACFPSISTRRTYSSLCDAASSLNRMSLCKRPRVMAKSANIKPTSHAKIVIFPFQALAFKMKPDYSKTRVHLWASLLRATIIKCRLPGDTGARGAPSTGVSSRTGALLIALDRWRLGQWCSSTAFLQSNRCSPQLSYSGRGCGVLFGSTSTVKCVPWHLL